MKFKALVKLVLCQLRLARGREKMDPANPVGEMFRAIQKKGALY